jgi:CHAT domain-containing protein
MGEYAKAEAAVRRCVAIREAKLTKHDRYLIECLEVLAMVCEASDRSADAADVIDRARRFSRAYVAQVLPILSSREQNDFLRIKDRGGYYRALSLGLRHAADQGLAARSAAWLLNGKAVIQQTSAEAILLARDSDDPATANLARRLADTRRQLARLTLTTSEPGQDAEYKRQLQDLTAREQDLAKQLSKAGNRAANADPWVDHGKVVRALPPDAALIDIARFDVDDCKTVIKPKERGRYVAWISRAGQPVRVLDLGPAQEIDAEVAKVRKALADAPKGIRTKGEPEAEAALRESLQGLAKRVLHPLLPHVGKTKHWVVSPDGNLWLAPWSALPLPNGKYAIEEHSIAYVVSGRDLVVATARANVQPSAPLVFADPDFDLGRDQVVRETRALTRGQQPSDRTRGLSRALNLGTTPRLPGTAAEAEAVAPRLRQYAGVEPRVYTNQQALAGVFQTARNPKVVLLSTHGFFLPTQEVEPAERDLHGTEAVKAVPGVENPLLRSGLLLAGCNHAGRAGEGEDNGVLTGLQIVGTDLRGCELVVLSACETGLGDVRNGEGVAGLRQAFQLAGAEAVVATLWQIPDRQSAQLMIRFFDELAAKKDKTTALADAQRAMIEERRAKNGAAHPFFWAAFTVTGR